MEKYWHIVLKEEEKIDNKWKEGKGKNGGQERNRTLNDLKSSRQMLVFVLPH